MAADPKQTERFVRTVWQLRCAPDLRVLPLGAVHLVRVMRLRASSGELDRDPVAELATRLGNVSAAVDGLRFATMVAEAWPEPFVVRRPCCVKLSHDEHALALMAVAAEAGDRGRFAAAIEGLVRAARYDRLFDGAVRALAGLNGVAV